MSSRRGGLTSYQAHSHASAALTAAHNSDTTVAVDEHANAAGEFSRAADSTKNAEALRTLRLLEAHHRRVAELLRQPTESTTNTITTEPEVQPTNEKPLSTSAAVAELRASKIDNVPRSASPLRTPPTLNAPRRLPPRDLSSSIASNLANARGIRTNYTRQPLSPSVSTQQAPGSLETPARREVKKTRSNISGEASQPSWLPPTTSQRKVDTSSASKLPEPVATTSQDEGFSRFYNTFENFLSKISAPLAFAGLPLIAEEATAPATTEITKKRTLVEKRDTSPDLAKYISRAAIRASTRDGNSANDSFYVVPTTGHTVSYARILSYEEKERRRLAASAHSENSDMFPDPDEDDDFVDARETPMPPSPAFSRQSSKVVKPTTRQLENKVEELDMENKSLKEVVDKLSKRLHTFEMSAQQHGMALQESMRIMRDLSPARDPALHRTSSAGGDEALKKRVRDLEEHVSLSGKEIDRLGKENEKLKIVVARYRDRWEKLKEGAKTRREGNGGKKDGEPAASPLL